PGQSSQIKSVYKSEIARTLEPWISGVSAISAGAGFQTGPAPSFPTASQLPKDYAMPALGLTSMDPMFSEPTYSQYYPMSRSTVTPQQPQGAPNQNLGSKSTAGLVGGGYAAPAGIGAGPHGGRKTPVPGHGGGHGGHGPAKVKGSSSNILIDPEESFQSHCRSFSAHFNVS
ncbi:unnamed protein product, partial [Allacma fusca]